MRYEVRNSVDVTQAAIITFLCAARRPRLIRIQPIEMRTADVALSVALSAGRSVTVTSDLVGDHQDPEQRQVGYRSEEHLSCGAPRARAREAPHEPEEGEPQHERGGEVNHARHVHQRGRQAEWH